MASKDNSSSGHEQDIPIKPVIVDNIADHEPPSEVLPVAAGVSKVEAFNRVLYNSGGSGKLLLITLVLSIGLNMFAYALDQGITSQFNVIAASSFGHHAEIGTVNTASQIIRAVSVCKDGAAKKFSGELLTSLFDRNPS
jgi:hypothetical protein